MDASRSNSNSRIWLVATNLTGQCGNERIACNNFKCDYQVFLTLGSNGEHRHVLEVTSLCHLTREVDCWEQPGWSGCKVGVSDHR